MNRRGYEISVLKFKKKDYFAKIIIKTIADSKTFWNVVKPYFTNEYVTGNQAIISY